MIPIDWRKILPNRKIDVAYSSLVIPDVRSSIDNTIAEIGFPDEGDYFIDVSWNDSEKKYTVTLYNDFFENWILQSNCADVHEVLETVRSFADNIGSPSVSASSVETQQSGELCFQ